MPFPKTGDHPEAMVNILITVIEKTPDGGATMDDLKQAYMTVKDQPDDALPREPVSQGIGRRRGGGVF
jgi:hypothetical protein